MKKFITLLAFSFVFFLSPHFAKADNVVCDFSYDNPTLPCDYEGETYDGYFKWTANDVYFYIDYYKQTECTITNTNTFIINCNGGDVASFQKHNNEFIFLYLFQATNLPLSYILEWEHTQVPYTSGSPYQVEFFIGRINEDWSEEDIGCVSATGDMPTSCGIDPEAYAIALQVTATSSVPNWKVEYQLFDLDGNVLEPQTAFAKSTNIPQPQTYATTWPIIFPPNNASSTYLLKVCVGDVWQFPLAFGESGTNSVCANMYIGNGFTQADFDKLLSDLGMVATSYRKTKTTAWIDNGCDDIGITEVFKGVKCALIYAFAPSAESLGEFTKTKNLMLSVYPIGYATFILRDVTSAFTSTSTTAFDKDIDIKRFFGQSGGTTTISVANLTSKMGMVQPIIDFISTVLWIIFVGWLLWWGLTRKL